jgi:putative addiction module component (TIGR02574 family)
MDLKTLEREVLNLPASDRAKLAHELLESLDNLSPKQLDEAWLDESERRLKEVDSGAVSLIPAEEVLRKARALLR